MDLTETDRDAIKRVIVAQIEAFQADDGIQAFLYAAPSIRQQFKSVGNFMRMVRSAYPAICQPHGVLFDGLNEMHGFPAQTVLLMGRNSEIVKAIYLMQRQSQRDWCIAGCFLVPLGED